MKTKVNEIPLVGPKGRSELIKKINETNENIDNRFKVLEEILGMDLNPNLDKKYYQYFTIEATQDGTKVYFRQSSYAANAGLDPLKVEVSTDNGKTWTSVTAAVAKNDVPGTVLAELDEGDKVFIRGKNDAYGFYDHDDFGDAVENCNFYADKPCYIYGNIMSLVGGDDFARLRKVEECAFPYFFSDCDSALYWSWVLSKQGEELLLPATKLAIYCYQSMFSNCTSITSAPELPATTLADCCYYGMFNNCTSLTTAPELPAATLKFACYFYMFSNCTSLTTAPDLPATTLVDSCYQSMFYGCTNLSYIKAMFITTPESSYTNNWVQNVKATGTFVKNSAATWNVTGNNGVPSGWTVETANS